ncbi:hypothetical protein ACLBKU_16790 [Erythrobacter sp. NE805]|uniref:hypothetical protein n=1 Tax=Erythrobacter sp. NE805 TaxID=3389875 RepID=UPI00396B173A
MGSQRKVRVRTGRRAKAKRRGLAALVAHRAFAPLLGLWGAGLGGLAVMVLPPALIEGLTRGTVIATYDLPLQAVIAGALAAVLGVALFLPAAARSAAARARIVTASPRDAAVRRVRPIDPARDLGTKSLDDPIETMPFATPAWRDADLVEPEPAPEPYEDAPPALDLAAFAELPDHDPVWVEEASPSPEPAAAAPQPARQSEAAAPEPRRTVAPLRPPAPGTAALARLRATPVSELSMAQMVERFAGALHEHRAAAPTRGLDAGELAAREAALAEALKALAVLTGAGAPPPVGDAEEPLRAALSRLHPRQGGARAH